MLHNILIRRAVPDDVESMFAAHRDAVRAKAGAFYNAEQMDAWEAKSTPERIAEKQAWLNAGHGIAFVAQHANTIIGFAEIIPGKKELGAVYVTPGSWKGLGGQLLSAAIEEARRHGINELACDSSLNAENFYIKHGFEAVEHSTHRLRDGIDLPCIKMKIRL